MNSGASGSKARFRLLKATLLPISSSLFKACGLSRGRVSSLSRTYDQASRPSSVRIRTLEYPSALPCLDNCPGRVDQGEQLPDVMASSSSRRTPRSPLAHSYVDIPPDVPATVYT
jgi:hypothetical protein